MYQTVLLKGFSVSPAFLAKPFSHSELLIFLSWLELGGVRRLDFLQAVVYIHYISRQPLVLRVLPVAVTPSYVMLGGITALLCCLCAVALP